MLSSLNALFRISAADSMAAPDAPPPSPESVIDLTNEDSDVPPYSPTQETGMLTHVRANMQEKWVSAQDALQYMHPEMSNAEMKRLVHRLPRAAYIQAYWPPDKGNEKDTECVFKAVKFCNVKLLLEGTDAERLDQTAQGFIDDMQCMDKMQTASYSREEQPDYSARYIPMILVTDSKVTSGQKRWRRDVSDRLLRPEVYYTAKRKRDAAFRQRKKAKLPLPTVEEGVVDTCSECELPCDQHFVHCSKNDTTPGLEKIDTISVDSNGQD